MLQELLGSLSKQLFDFFDMSCCIATIALLRWIYFDRYLAPEYFMHGKVNNKIDVYAFGVVLLELISGKKPLCNGCPKGQESLVMWVGGISLYQLPLCANVMFEYVKRNGSFLWFE